MLLLLLLKTLHAFGYGRLLNVVLLLLLLLLMLALGIVGGSRRDQVLQQQAPCNSEVQTTQEQERLDIFDAGLLCFAGKPG